MAWGRSSAGDATRRTSASLMLRRGLIQPAEVLENQAPLLGGETAELVPGRVADLWTRARGARLQDAGNVHAVTDGGAAGAVLLFVGLLTGEGATGVEQFSVQAFLALDGPGVQPSRFQLACQIARFLGKRACRTRVASRLQPLELFGELSLARRELPQALHRPFTARAHHRQEALRVAVHALLLLRHAGELLERFLEARSRFGAGDLFRIAHQGVRRL